MKGCPAGRFGAQPPLCGGTWRGDEPSGFPFALDQTDAPYGQLRYYDLGGSPLSFGVGRTYVVIVPLDCDISFS